MKKNFNKITDKEQKIVAEILTMFMFAKTIEEVFNIWDDLYNTYHLCNDPFTGFPCSSKEAIKNQYEKEKQIMLERYGHCDGL